MQIRPETMFNIYTTCQLISEKLTNDLCKLTLTNRLIKIQKNCPFFTRRNLIKIVLNIHRSCIQIEAKCECVCAYTFMQIFCVCLWLFMLYTNILDVTLLHEYARHACTLIIKFHPFSNPRKWNFDKWLWTKGEEYGSYLKSIPEMILLNMIQNLKNNYKKSICLKLFIEKRFERAKSKIITKKWLKLENFLLIIFYWNVVCWLVNWVILHKKS